MKTRFFSHLDGGDDPDAERIYRWHIDKRRSANAAIGLGMDYRSTGKLATDDYVEAANVLLASMKAGGFFMSQAIPLHVSGEILDGAHRLACALTLDKDIWAKPEPGRLWTAPAWGRQWFADNGLGQSDMDRLLEDWAALCRRGSEGMKQWQHLA